LCQDVEAFMTGVAIPQQTAQRRGHVTVDEHVPWLPVALLLLMLLSLAWSLSAADWTEGMIVGQWAVIGGVLTGALLATTSWPRWFVRLHATITGLAWTLYLTSTRIPDAFTGPERPIQVIKRLMVWGAAAFAGEPIGDNLVFVADVTLLLWLVSVFTALGLVRNRRTWGAILPGGIALVVNAYYAPRDLTPFLLTYLVSALLLLVAVNLEERLVEWSRAHVRYPMDIALDFLRDGLLFTLMAVAIAWSMPTAADSERIDRALRPLKEPWHRVQEEWGRMFNALNYQPGLAVPVFGRSFNFRGAPNLTKTVIFTIEASEGRYWRSAVYDYYRGNGWDSTTTTTLYLDANESVPFVAWPQSKLITQTVTAHPPGAMSLIAAPHPVSFSIPVEADVVPFPDTVETTQLTGPNADVPGEILFAYARQNLEAGESYVVVSLVSDPDATALRHAGTEYPEWIAKPYLQLPETLPQRVRELALQITALYDTPYDKAKAIEGYLRAIPYNEQIPFPPASRDAVDWFLFDLQEGYCDYYASAFAVLARVAGIPTRVASGYARGLYDKEAHLWTVREEDAHTWPEVWFPGYGWIQFEPTPSEPPLERHEGGPLGPQQGESDLLRNLRNEDRNIPKDEVIPNQRLLTNPLARWPIAGPLQHIPWLPGLALTILVLVIYQGWQMTRRRLLSRPDLAATLYRRLVRWARRAGVPVVSSQTPTEQARVIAEHMSLEHRHVHRLVEAYQITAYGPPSLRERVLAQPETLLGLWERLQPVLWRTWAGAQWRRVTHRFRRAGQDSW